MKYIRLFNNHAEYLAYKNSEDYITPNVSYCKQEVEAHFEKYVPSTHDYSQDYLTFEALEDTEFSVKYVKDRRYITQAMRESFSYSVDNGETWVTFSTPNDTYSGTALTTPTISRGEKVLFKGIGNCNYNGAAHCCITSNGTFNAYGNIMSLIYGDNFIGQTNLSNTVQPFWRIFGDSSKLVDAENLILPATALTENCYTQMFYGCTSLTTAPELPATTLANYCYMSMFYGCTSLTTAPELPATTLAQSCYQGMFEGCTSLTTAPELRAETLALRCCQSMFYGCTSLTTAPELRAETLVEQCYLNMFDGCTSLNYIKAMFTTTPDNSYTGNWVLGVSATGTFVKNSAATWNVTGINGVPTGWTVETASA